MSADFQTISKGVNLPVSRDYAKLRSLGIGYIEKLGSSLWTDYNTHDPGITFLEMMCYAITDLGYRTNFDIKDILALEPGLKYFHTAAEILTMNPVTINDYRKLIIDVEGVRNAWLIPTSKGGFYLNEKDEILQWLQEPGDLEVFVKGYYETLLEFEEDDEYGDLNELDFSKTVEFIDGEEEIDFIFPKWTDLTDDANDTQIKLWARSGTTTAIAMDPAIEVDGELNAYKVKAKVDFTYPTPTPEIIPPFACKKDNIEGEELLEGPPFVPGTEVGSFEIEFFVRYVGTIEGLEGAIFDALENDAADGIIIFYQGRLNLQLKIVAEVRCALMDHRNLCEDFLEINSLKTEEIALCADIEISRIADVNFILAQIYQIVGEFISPTVHFYTLEEMFSKTLPSGQKYTSDRIFNGPRLQHGFILDEELDAAILKQEIHTSDIYNLIMDIPGVLAVKELQIANFIDGLPLTKGEEWILKLKGDGLHVPKLSQDRSKITFYKDVLPYKANPEKVAEYLAEQKAKSLRLRLEDTELDIPVPEADSPGIGEYSSIMNGFPLTFGIGQDGIPGNPDNLRRAQGKQLKGYLMFVDQLLANYMSQLAHVRDLLSMDPEGDTRTYFTQVIEDIKDVEELYRDYDENLADPFANVQDNLDLIAESDEVRYERKNRFLDHLLARFAENFAEYSLVMFALDKENAAQELVEDKLQFLNDYPEISGNRFRAYNYRPKVDCGICDPYQLWETFDNVSGYKKRVSRLLGIDSYERRNLTCHCFSIEEIDHHGIRPNTWVFVLRDCNGLGDVLLRSVEFESEDTAKFMINYALAMVEKENLIRDPETEGLECKCCDVVDVDKLSDYVPVTGFRFVLLNRCGNVIACSPGYVESEERDEKFTFTHDYILDYCTVEGFHLIEHILLRPELPDDETGDDFLPICLCDDDEDGTETESQAPYSDLFYEFFENGIKTPENIQELDQEALLQIWEEQKYEFENWIQKEYSKTPKVGIDWFGDAHEKVIPEETLEEGSKEGIVDEKLLSEDNAPTKRLRNLQIFEEKTPDKTPLASSLTYNKLSVYQIKQLQDIFEKYVPFEIRQVRKDAIFNEIKTREEKTWNGLISEAQAKLNPPITLWAFRVLSNKGKTILKSLDFDSIDEARRTAALLERSRKSIQNYKLSQSQLGKGWIFEIYGNIPNSLVSTGGTKSDVTGVRKQLLEIRRVVSEVTEPTQDFKSGVLNGVRLVEEQLRNYESDNLQKGTFDTTPLEKSLSGLNRLKKDSEAGDKTRLAAETTATTNYKKFKKQFDRSFPWIPSGLSYEIYEENDDDGKSELRFRIRDEATQKIIMSSSTHYPTREAAEKEMQIALNAASKPGGLKEENARNRKYYFNVVDEKGNIVARRIAVFKSTRDRTAAMDLLTNSLKDSMMNGEVLLKPYVENPLSEKAYLDHLDDWKVQIKSGLAAGMDIDSLKFGRLTKNIRSLKVNEMILATGNSPSLDSRTAGLDRNYGAYLSMYRTMFEMNHATLIRLRDDKFDKTDALADYREGTTANDELISVVTDVMGWFGLEEEVLSPQELISGDTGQTARDFSNLLGFSNIYPSQGERNAEANRLLGIFQTIAGPVESPVPPKKKTKYCGEEADPYSFRISIILPSWPGRFKDINFRQLVEKTLRLEAPAHVALKICWIDRYQMADFECVYLNWILAKGKCDATPETISGPLNELIAGLNKLQNVYPVATLHDCDDSQEDTPAVILNHTSLGTL